MFRFKSLFYDLSVFMGIILLTAMSSVPGFATEKLAPADSKQGPEIFVQLGHGMWVQRVAISSDGKYLLSGGWGGAVKLWDVQSGREIRTLPGHQSAPSLAFSPDGRRAVSFENGLEGIIKLWDLQSGREIYTVTKKGYFNYSDSISFLSNGKYFMISGLRSPVYIWETATGLEIGGVNLPDDFQNKGGQMIVSPDGRFALTQRQGEPGLRGFVQEPAKLWNLLTGRVIRELGRTMPYHSVFTPDGSRVLSPRYEDKSLELWDAATGSVIWSRKGHTGSVDSIMISESGTIAVSASKDEGTMRVWDVATGRQLQVIATPGGYKPNKLSPDGRKIIFASEEGPLSNNAFKIFDTLTGHELKEFKKENGFQSMSFTPDGEKLLLTSIGRITLWDIPTDREVQSFAGNGQTITSVTFAPQRTFAVIVGRKDVSLWDIAAGKRVMVLKGHQKDVSSVAFSPTTGTLVTGSLDTTLRFWDLQTGKERLSVPGHAGGVLSVAYSPDGRTVASAGNDAVIKLWDGASGALLKTLTGHIRGRNKKAEFTGVYAVAFSPDGKKLVSAGADGAINLWDTVTGKEIRSLRGHDGDVTSVAFSPDGRALVSGGWDGTVRLWDAQSGKELKTLSKTDDGAVSFVGYSPDGRYIFARGVDEIVRLWSAATGQEIKQFAGTRTLTTMIGTMNSAAVSPDSRYLLTNDGPGAVSRVWNIATGKEIVQFISFTDGEWVAITPEGYFSASPGGARHLNVRVGNNVYGIDQFYARFYRPELVVLALAGKKLPQGELITDIAAQKPAPNVQILSPATNSSVDQDSVAVTLKITDSGGGIGAVNVYLNGAQVANDTRGLIIKDKAAVSERILSFTIPLIAGPNEIRAIAFNKENSMESSPALVSIISNAVAQKPNLYALIIGINTYKNKSIALTYAVPDAIAFGNTLQKSASPLFAKMDIQVLTTPEATTKEAIIKSFEQLRLKIKPNDLFVFYDASHGIVDVVNNEEQYFLLTSNVLLLSSRNIGKDAMSQKDLAKLVGNIPAQKKLVILDTCNAGKGGKEIQIALLQQTRGLNESTAVKLLQRTIGSAVFSSSSDTQQALEGYKGHGLFTYVLMEGLRGKADIKKDGFITIYGLADYVGEQVVNLSEEVFKRQQTPTVQTSADFPIGLIK